LNILVVGGGGREHALAWKIAQSPRVARVLVAPGNGGTACDPALANVAETEIAALVELARSRGIAFTVVGPEAPLAAGIVDAFRAKGLKIFGPTRAAAQLESSKDFAKAFMRAMDCRPRNTARSPTRAPRTTTWRRAAPPLSSRPTASPRARV